MSPRRAALVLALILATGQCIDSTGPSRSGTLNVLLQNAGTNDGAMLFQVADTSTGQVIDTVLAAPGSAYRVFVQRQSNTRWRVIVTGSLVDGTLVQVVVPDTGQVSAYSGKILDVADATFADLPPGTRSITVAP
ncbi:MAG TPA: hypothetical protein VEM13_06415 [Gemmatimonadales bacterium]|nr:hypothetical protein [Gemmatimonadales bacterium]